MKEVPQFAEDYMPEDLELVKSGCIEVAARLNDLLDDILLVGGAVPALLIDHQQEFGISTDTSDPLSAHVGTRDLDLGLAVGVLNKGRYSEISTRLKESGFKPDENASGNQTTHRWKHCDAEKLTIDFLIAPAGKEETGGNIKNLESDFSAIVVPGLDLALEDPHPIQLSGTALDGSKMSIEIPVCGPAGFVLLKALACKQRGKDKDKYDLFYVLRNYKKGPEGVAESFRPFLERGVEEAERSVNIMKAYFNDSNSRGPRAVSNFLYGRQDDTVEADAAAFVQAFLRAL